MSGMHFDRIAAEYAGARPQYPDAVYETLRADGVIGPGARVLEVGAGSGLATRELVGDGCEVVALEPGPALAQHLRDRCPGVQVVVERLEDADLPEGSFDAVVAATAMHWVDLAVGLPALHAALRPHGHLAVWRTVFGDESVQTEFRRRVAGIVSGRPGAATSPRRSDRPSMEELAAGGWFEPVRSEEWRWSMDLSVDEVLRLFRTFSDWSAAEVEAAARAADELGGRVTEHYRTFLHVLRRAPREVLGDQP